MGMPRTSSRFANAAMLFACLIGAVVAEEAEVPPALETLEQAVGSRCKGTRNARKSLHRLVGIPDVVAVTRSGQTQVHVTASNYLQEVRFRRESDARVLADPVPAGMRLTRDQLTTGSRAGARDFAFELTENVDEADGLPAEIPFGAHTSLINTDYVRLRNAGRETVTSLAAVLSPQSRRCDRQLTLNDLGDDYPHRFVLLADTFKECERTLKSREGDLFFADDVPAALRQTLLDLVTRSTTTLLWRWEASLPLLSLCGDPTPRVAAFDSNPTGHQQPVGVQRNRVAERTRTRSRRRHCGNPWRASRSMRRLGMSDDFTKSGERLSADAGEIRARSRDQPAPDRGAARLDRGLRALHESPASSGWLRAEWIGRMTAAW